MLFLVDSSSTWTDFHFDTLVKKYNLELNRSSWVQDTPRSDCYPLTFFSSSHLLTPTHLLLLWGYRIWYWVPLEIYQISEHYSSPLHTLCSHMKASVFVFALPTPYLFQHPKLLISKIFSTAHLFPASWLFGTPVYFIRKWYLMHRNWEEYSVIVP